jgi:arylsulfatase A-like enzyme
LAPGVVEGPVHLVDLLPTVLARCGIEAPRNAQGQALIGPLLPAAFDSGRAPRPVFVSRFVFPEDRAAGHGLEQVAMIEFPFKLIVTAGDAARPARTELFDLAADAREQSNLAATETERVRRMTRALHAFLRAQQDARAAFLRAHGGGTADASPEMLEQLRALGYAR